MKTEGIGTNIETNQSGAIELIGGLVYPVWKVPENVPSFIVNDSEASFIYAVSNYKPATGTNFAVQIQEEQHGVTKSIPSSSLPARGFGTMMPLYRSANLSPIPSSVSQKLPGLVPEYTLKTKRHWSPSMKKESLPIFLSPTECATNIRRFLIGLLFCVPVAAQVSPYAGKIDHVIVIIQENHSFDHYFGHLPGIPGNPVTTGQLAGVGTKPLVHLDPTQTYPDPPHDYLSMVAAIDGGAMDNFPLKGTRGYSYYDCSDLAFYCDMATTFGLATNYWPQRGPSYPTHFGFIAAPIDIVNNPNTVRNADRWTCFATKYNGFPCTAPGCSYEATWDFHNVIVDDSLNYPANSGTTMYHAGVCIDHVGIACTDTNASTACASHGGSCDLSRCIANKPGCICPSVTTVGSNLSAAGVSHTWYGPGAHTSGAFWEAPYYEQAAAFGSESGNMKISSQYMSDVSGNTLPVISWISPSRLLSEHPEPDTTTGTVANGAAQTETFITQCFNYPANCYNHTLILLTWDDGGGYYDHVAPSSTQDGVRTPLICIGPYCKNTFVTTYLTQAGVLKCVEDVAGISYIGPRDANAMSVCAANGSAMIDLSQTPIPVPTSYPLPTLSGRRFGHDSPDLVDAANWLWRKLHPNHEKELPQIALKQRPCDPSTPLRDWAMFKPTGQLMEFCHDAANNYILAPGQTLDDKEDSDERPKAKKHKRLRAAIDIGATVAAVKLADDLVDNPRVLGPKKAMYVSAGVGAVVWWALHRHGGLKGLLALN